MANSQTIAASNGAQIYVQALKDYLRRNNPVDVIARQVIEFVYNLVTFNSKMKLLKYKFMLAQQQLNKMESHIQNGSPYNIYGKKINRHY